MNGSQWKSYLDPQIEARNRWAVHRYPRVENLPERGRAERTPAAPVHSGVSTGVRPRIAAALVGLLLFAAIVVLALRIPPTGNQVLAPARLPAATVHVGGTPTAPGVAPARLGQAVPR